MIPKIEQIIARARPNIQKLKPYSSARLGADAEELQNSILLNANENPYPPSAEPEGHSKNYYPEPQPQALLQALAQIYRSSAQQILVGRGSDEAIDLLIRAFCGEDDAIVICSPTFGMYRSYAEIQGCQIIDIPLEELPQGPKLYQASLPMTQLRKILASKPKLFFLPSPLAPLGSMIPQQQLLELLELCAQHSVVLAVDEAYAEFAEILQPDQYQSMLAYLPKFPNLVVLRTLSKAYSLAGERIGSLLADAQLVTMLRATQSPYPIPSSIGSYATALLNDQKALETTAKSIKKLCEQQRRLFTFLQSLPYLQKIFQSAANFVMIQVSPQDCRAIIGLCRQHGLILRDFSQNRDGTIRISVGTAEQMDKLMKIFLEYGATHAIRTL